MVQGTRLALDSFEEAAWARDGRACLVLQAPLVRVLELLVWSLLQVAEPVLVVAWEAVLEAALMLIQR